MKLKPVTIINARYSRYGQNTAQQIFLLKALTVTQNPEELRKMMGVKKVAEVYRTLDKLALRKEFHAALAKQGIDFNYIVNGLKTEAESADKSADRIKVYQTLLKALGMDKYDEGSQGGGAWEDAVLQAKQKSFPENKKELPQGENKEYSVTYPEVPESVRKRNEEQAEVGRGLYE